MQNSIDIGTVLVNEAMEIFFHGRGSVSFDDVAALVTDDDVVSDQGVVGHAGRCDVIQICFRIAHGDVAPCFYGQIAVSHGDAGLNDLFLIFFLDNLFAHAFHFIRKRENFNVSEKTDQRTCSFEKMTDE